MRTVSKVFPPGTPRWAGRGGALELTAGAVSVWCSFRAGE